MLANPDPDSPNSKIFRNVFPETNPENLPTVNSDEFLPAIGNWITVGGCLLVAVVGGSIVLAARTGYTTVVKAPAIVRPMGEIRVVQASTVGVVTAILGKENQRVETGDAIATLDDSPLLTQTSEVLQQITQAQQEQLQLQAQLDALADQASAKQRQQTESILSAKAELGLKERNYQDRKVQAIAQVQEAKAQVDSAESEWREAQATLKALQSGLRSHQISLKSAQVKASRYQQAAQLGALSLDQLAEVQLTVRQEQQAIESQVATIAAQQQKIANRYQAWQAMQAKLQQQQTQLNPSSGEVAMAKANMNQIHAANSVDMATIQQERERLLRQQVVLHNQQIRDRQHLVQLQRDHQQSVVKAPVTGKILQLFVHNPGQVVQAGTVIAKIVPEKAGIIIKARVAAQDISQIQSCRASNLSTCKTGLAYLKISAYPYPSYGTLKGVITDIADDTTQTETDLHAPLRLSDTPATYEVTILPEQPFILKAGRHYPLKNGMEVTAEMVTHNESLLNFILRKTRLLLDPS